MHVHDVRAGREGPGVLGGPDQRRCREVPHVGALDGGDHGSGRSADDHHLLPGIVLGGRQEGDVPLHAGEPVGTDDVQDPHAGPPTEPGMPGDLSVTAPPPARDGTTGSRPGVACTSAWAAA